MENPVKKKKYSSHFQKAWRDDPEISPWLREVAGQSTKAFCGICRSEFSIADAGLYTVRLHAKGQGHKAKAEVHARMKPLTTMFARRDDHEIIKV